jgi:hypothetical protein
MRYILIRHGQSDIGQGSQDESPLNARGISLSEWLCKNLDLQGSVTLLAEDCERCRQTLGPLSKRLKRGIKTHKSFTRCKGLIATELPQILSTAAEGEQNVVYCYRREALVGLNSFFGLNILQELHLTKDDLYQTIVVLEKNNSGWHVANTIDNGHPKEP